MGESVQYTMKKSCVTILTKENASGSRANMLICVLHAFQLLMAHLLARKEKPTVNKVGQKIQTSD